MTVLFKPKTKTGDLPRAPGRCALCGVLNTMVYIPKSRNGVQGRYCTRCNSTCYKTNMEEEI